jgi:hypothetical protein
MGNLYQIDSIAILMSLLPVTYPSAEGVLFGPRLTCKYLALNIKSGIYDSHIIGVNPNLILSPPRILESLIFQFSSQHGTGGIHSDIDIQ